MKIKKEHYAFLAEQIQAFLMSNPGIVEKYERGEFPRSEHTKDLQRRFCFDMLLAVNGLNKFVCDAIYSYANDDHLETALRRICPKVTKKY